MSYVITKCRQVQNSLQHIQRRVFPHLRIDSNNNSGCWIQVKRHLLKSFLKNVQSQWYSTQDSGMLYYPPQPHISFFSVVLLVLVGITYFSVSLQTYSWHASVYAWNYIVFLREAGSTATFPFCHTWLAIDTVDHKTRTHSQVQSSLFFSWSSTVISSKHHPHCSRDLTHFLPAN